MTDIFIVLAIGLCLVVSAINAWDAANSSWIPAIVTGTLGILFIGGSLSAAIGFGKVSISLNWF